MERAFRAKNPAQQRVLQRSSMSEQHPSASLFRCPRPKLSVQACPCLSLPRSPAIRTSSGRALGTPQNVSKTTNRDMAYSPSLLKQQYESVAKTGAALLLSCVLAVSASPNLANADGLLSNVQSSQIMKETLVEAWDAVEERFVDTYDHSAFVKAREDSIALLAKANTAEDGYNIIQGMLATLGDHYTRLLPPSQASAFKADTTGQVVHVGMQAQKVETEAGPFMRVSFVLTGSPAHEAGMAVGDIIHTVNGRPAAGIDRKELTALLHQGVHLQVAQSRPQTSTTQRTIYLPARPVEVYPVVHKSLDRHDGGITGYIAIQSFGNNTAHDAAAALASLQQEGATSLILDLRGNNGGLVNAGVSVAGLLRHENEVFGYISYKDGAEFPLLIETEGSSAGTPLVVLVNGGTASTSEMLTGALHAGGRARVIGEHTFGKGRTQRVIQMHDNSTLLVSNALVTTPAHERIDKVGLEPDQFCRSGSGLPDALKTEPLEAEKLAADLQADQCVQMALSTLRSASAGSA